MQRLYRRACEELAGIESLEVVGLSRDFEAEFAAFQQSEPTGAIAIRTLAEAALVFPPPRPTWKRMSLSRA